MSLAEKIHNMLTLLGLRQQVAELVLRKVYENPSLPPQPLVCKHLTINGMLSTALSQDVCRQGAAKWQRKSMQDSLPVFANFH